MHYLDSDEFKLLFAHVRDLLDRPAAEALSTAFLNPKEQYFLSQELRRLGAFHRTLFSGGAPGAARQKLFVLPLYVCDLCEDGGLFDAAKLYLGDEAFSSIVPLCITGGGFRTFTHRDYLGSLLSLGISRASLGDIVPTRECAAVVFADAAVADFLCGENVRIASDKVRITRATLPQSFCIVQRFSPVSDTVASPRLDAVAAALGNLSRERAKEEILRGAVELNYEAQSAPDAPVAAGDILTLHGVGKFEIAELSDKTKKGRLRLLAKRYE